jgi:hypothetical protein
MDKSLFVNPETLRPLRLLCSYCDKVPESPEMLLDSDVLCLHVFCSSCLEKHNPSHCPSCNRAIVKRCVDTRTADILATQLVKCPNEGCTVTGMLGRPPKTSLDEHTPTCQFNKAKCTFCAKSFTSTNQLSQHICPQAPMDCPFVRFGCTTGEGTSLSCCQKQHECSSNSF